MARVPLEVVVAQREQNSAPPDKLTAPQATVHTASQRPGYPGPLHPGDCAIALLRAFLATGRRRV